MPRAGAMATPKERLGWLPVVAAIVVVGVFGLLTLPRLGLPAPLMVLGLLLWVLALAWTNTKAVSGLTAAEIRIPAWRRNTGLVMALVVVALGMLSAQEAELRGRVQAVNDHRADREMSALPPQPPPELAAERLELDELLARDPESDPLPLDLIGSQDATQNALDTIQLELPCEVDGTCGSLRPGAREIYDAKVKIRNGLREQLVIDRQAVIDRRAAVATERSDARSRLSALTDQIELADRARLASVDEIDARRSDVGPWRRLEELWRLPPGGAAGAGVMAAAALLFALALVLDLGVLLLLLRYYRKTRRRSRRRWGFRRA